MSKPERLVTRGASELGAGVHPAEVVDDDELPMMPCFRFSMKPKIANERKVEDLCLLAPYTLRSRDNALVRVGAARQGSRTRVGSALDIA